MSDRRRQTAERVAHVLRGRRHDFYKLEGHEAVPATLEEMGHALEDKDARTVARTETDNGVVSTVFLCINHSYAAGDPPLLFETLVMGGTFDDAQVRYTTWDEAVAGHAEMVRRITVGPNRRVP